MTTKKKLTLGAGVAIFIIVVYSIAQGVQDYTTTVLENRAEINDFMRTSAESPLPDSIKSDFSTLNFYPVDEKYKVSAKLELIPNNEMLSVGTSDGVTKDYIRYAYAHFTLSEIEHRVLILKSKDDEGTDYLFLPFGDRTNGEETYGGGRYLDLEPSSNSRLAIDFNLAYNPYCAYNASYSCPLPPAENQLNAAIRAGEQNFK